MDFFDVVKTRQSVRAFKKQKVDPETLTRLLEAIRSSPTAGNLQAYQVYLVETPSTIKALGKAAYDQECVSRAPVVLVFCADGERSQVKYKARGMTLYCLQDTTIAATFGHLAATALGLGSVLVGAFKEVEVSQLVNAPPSQRPILLLPVGHPDEIPAATERRSLADLVIRC
ncbi:nitroreductase family protein [Candidatus Zixiibacteriota bacterium]